MLISLAWGKDPILHIFHKYWILEFLGSLSVPTYSLTAGIVAKWHPPLSLSSQSASSTITITQELFCNFIIWLLDDGPISFQRLMIFLLRQRAAHRPTASRLIPRRFVLFQSATLRWRKNCTGYKFDKLRNPISPPKFAILVQYKPLERI